jgi:membrane protein
VRVVSSVRLAIRAFRKDNASRFGAALAFYIVFSIAPTLLIAMAIAGRVFGQEQAEREILHRLSGSIGPAPAAAIAAMIEDAASAKTGWLATALALTTLYFGVTGVYRQIDDALRTIWRITIRRKLTSMLLVLATGVVLLLSLLADAAIAATGARAAARLAGGEALWHSAQLTVSTLVLTALLGLVFRSMMKPRLPWQDVLPGAAMTAVLFVIGKFGLGIYLGKAAVGSAFGAAGSIVVVLLWAYWSAQIFFFGLELIYVSSRKSEQA